MQYITLVSDSYEKAVEEAKRKYGSSLRIISRKEYTSGGGIFTRKRRKCEITFYLVEEKPAKEEKKKNVTRQDLAEFEQEARTPDPETLTSQERLDTLKPARDLEKADSTQDRAAEILDKNEIGMSLRSHILDGFDAGDDLSLAICDKIISSVMIDHENQAHPRKYQVFLGPTGSGKTTTLAKIASLYKTVGKNVASRAFVNEELMLEMRPIVCKLYNADRESEYAEGFTADVSVDENGDMARFLPFGNPDELMLYTALNLINGTQSGTQQAAAQTVTVKYNSVARKASQAVEM